MAESDALRQRINQLEAIVNESDATIKSGVNEHHHCLSVYRPSSLSLSQFFERKTTTEGGEQREYLIASCFRPEH